MSSASHSLRYAFAFTLVLSGCTAGLVGARDLPEVPEDASAWADTLERRLSEEGVSASTLSHLALARIAQGRLAEAERLVSRALSRSHCAPTVLAASATVALARGAPEVAVNRYDRASRCASEPLGSRIQAARVQAHLALAGRRLASGRLADALALLERAHPWLAEAEYEGRQAFSALASKAADGALRQGARDLAQSALHLALEHHGDGDVARRQRGQLRVLQGEVEQGASALQAWAGQDLTRWTHLARFYEGLGDRAQALSTWRRATALESALPETWRAYTEAAVALGESEEACQAALAGAETLSAVEERAAFLVAAAEREAMANDAGDGACIERLLSQAVSVAPQHWPALRALSGFLVRQRKGDAVIVALQRYCEGAQEPLEALERSANLLDGLGLGRAAVGLLERTVASPEAPEGAELLLVKSLHKRRSDWGRRDEVLSAYEQSVAEDFDAALAVGRLWVTYRQPERARVIGTRLRSLRPDRFEGGLLLADAYRALRRPRSETSVITATVAAASKPVEASLAIGLRYLEWREYARAVRWLEGALKGASDETIQRRAHRGLIDAMLGQHPPARKEAATHMRRWLSLTPEAEQPEALAYLLQRVGGTASLSELRLELLQALVTRRPDEPEGYESLGKALLDEERWEMACDAFRRAIALSPQPRALTLRVGRSLVSVAQLERALGFLERVQLSPRELDVQAWRILGEHLYAAGRLALADVYFGKLLERTKAGGHGTELSIFARAALKLGAWRRAEEAARQLLDYREENREAMRTLGEALYRQGHREDGAQWFRRYLKAAPSSQRAKVHLTIGQQLIAMGHLAQGAQILEEALGVRSMRPSSALFEQLVKVRRRMGDGPGLIRAARLHVAQARSLRATARASLTAARALEGSGHLDEAWRVLSSALKTARGDRALLEAAAANALDRGEVDVAVTLFERLGRQRGGDARVWHEVSEKLVGAGQIEAAVGLLKRIAERPDTAVGVQVELGRRFLEQGRFDEAAASFQGAVTQALSLIEVAKEVDKAYRAVGQLRRLESFYVGLVGMAPMRKEFPLTLGSLRLELGQSALAQQSFARYLAARPRGHLAVARAYAEHGVNERALSHYRRAWEQPAPGGEALPLSELARWLAKAGELERLDWFVNLHVRRASQVGSAAREASEAYEAVGEVAKALRWLREADKLAPDPKHALGIGQLLLALGDRPGARAAWTQYIERRRSRGGMTRSRRATSQRPMAAAVVEVAERWAMARHLDEAIRTVQRGVEAYGDAPLLAVTEARFLIQRGEVSGGLTRVRQSKHRLKQAPVEALKELVDALLERDRKAALAALFAEVEVETWNQELGLIYLGVLGELERSEEAARLAGALTRTGKPEVHLAVGVQAFRAGLYELAVRHLERALRDGVEEPIKATRILDAISVLRPGLVEAEASESQVRGAFAEDRLGTLLLRAQRQADAYALPAALEDTLKALSLAPDDLRLFELGLFLCALSGDAQGLDKVVSLLRSRQHSRLDVLKVAVRRLAHGLRPSMARRLQSQVIAAQPGVAEHHLVAVRLALQGGDDLAARWHSDALLAIAGEEPEVLLQLAEHWQDWWRHDAAEALLARLDREGGVIAIEREMLRLKGALMAGDSGQAQEIFGALVGDTESAPHLRYRALSMALEFGHGTEAVRAWLGPTQGTTWVTDSALALRARIAWRTGHLEDARNALDALLKVYHVGSHIWGPLLSALVYAGDVPSLTRLVSHLPTRALWSMPRVAMAGMSAAALDFEARRMTPENKQVMAQALTALVAEASHEAPSASSSLAAALAVAAEVSERPDDALEAYEAPLIAMPNSPVHANNLAYILARFDRDLDRALELIVAARLRAAEPVMSYTDTEAWVRYKMGQFEVARDLMAMTVHGAHERESEAPQAQGEMLFHYAAALEAVGEQERAAAIWRDCARRDPLSPYGARCLARLKAKTPRPSSPGP